ncbi:unnamed protein product [Debaryomyces fabryi]|nr:unnamed protein product [Debaryomyces fabryi]
MNQYDNKETIYSGPNAVVYKAIDRESQNIVALKVVDVDLCMKPHDIRREITTLQRIQNKGILQYLNLYTHGDDIILVTPCYQFDLDQWIKRCIKKKVKFNLDDPTNNMIHYRNEFPTDKIKKIMSTLADVLRYLHDDEGIIHRDIKPSNVYFESEDSPPVLGDFGIMYNTKAPPPDEPMESKYTDVSTGIFKAPELCFGMADYTQAIDIWSLGIIFTLLYSTTGKSCIDEEGNFHDLTLISSIFQNFGTPLTSDASDKRLYWPDANRPQSHFNSFKFTEKPRKPLEELLPRCDDPNMLHIFDRMMVYQGSERITAKEILTCIE